MEEAMKAMNSRYKVFFDEQKRIFNLDFNYFLNILDINVKIKCEAWGAIALNMLEIWELCDLILMIIAKI